MRGRVHWPRITLTWQDRGQTQRRASELLAQTRDSREWGPRALPTAWAPSAGRCPALGLQREAWPPWGPALEGHTLKDASCHPHHPGWTQTREAHTAVTRVA